jgi:hypothetical protein
MYSQLARQLEYYFSEQNLSKDAYLQTLKSLNDACVPLSIVADFSKIKALTSCLDSQGRRQAVLRAIQEHSDLLQVYRIDTKTGKKVKEDTDLAANEFSKTKDGSVSLQSTFIFAIGTLDGNPLRDQVTLDTVSLTSTLSPSMVNTLILRDVDPSVTCDDVKLLLERDIKDCPKIMCIRPDVAYCWYVT